MKSQHKWIIGLGALSMVFLVGCASERTKNHAKEMAAKYWQDKAYPGKAFDIQVVEAEKADGGQYRVRGIVDGETRVGTFNPETETFSEGYYSLAHEREKRVAELEQEVKYWKEKFENADKEVYKLKLKMKLSSKGKFEDDSESKKSDKEDSADSKN